MKVQQVSPGIINKIKSLIARVGYLKSDIGIVEDTDTATHTISSGQYVIWKNELYKASTAIPSGDPLSSTNLTAVSDGIANELNSNIIDIMARSSVSISAGTNVTIATQSCTLYAAMRLLFISCMIQVGSGGLAANSTVIELPTGCTFSGRHDYQIGSVYLYGGSSGTELKIAAGSLSQGTYDIVMPVTVVIS